MIAVAAPAPRPSARARAIAQHALWTVRRLGNPRALWVLDRGPGERPDWRLQKRQAGTLDLPWVPVCVVQRGFNPDSLALEVEAALERSRGNA